MSEKKRLGRGLSALLGNSSSSCAKENFVQEITLDKIDPNPWQPRKVFSQESIEELAQSIEKNSLIQPITLRKDQNRFQIVTGERRFRAFQYLKRNTIPALIVELSDREMIIHALLENIQREDLNPIDEANTFLKLTEEFEITHETLAQTIGKSRSRITNSLRLLKLPDSVKNYIESGLLSPGGARAILALSSEEMQKKAASEAIVQGMNVRQIEKYVKDLLENKRTHRSSEPQSVTLAAYQAEFEKLFSMKTRLKYSGGKTKMEIVFTQEEEIPLLLEKLRKIHS